MVKLMTPSTTNALKLVYRSPGKDRLHQTIACALIRRGLVSQRGSCLNRAYEANATLRLTEDGLRFCKALFGPLKGNDMDRHMSTPNELGLCYVVLWNFELEDSGNLVKDGLVFSTVENAKTEAGKKFLQELDNDFSSKARPIWSVRLRKWGYVAGDVTVVAIPANHPVTALEGALVGKGEEVLN